MFVTTSRRIFALLLQHTDNRFVRFLQRATELRRFFDGRLFDALVAAIAFRRFFAHRRDVVRAASVASDGRTRARVVDRGGEAGGAVGHCHVHCAVAFVLVGHVLIPDHCVDDCRAVGVALKHVEKRAKLYRRLDNRVA